MSQIKRPRRYALFKRRAADVARDYAIRDVWKAKQEAEAGTALPASFPLKAELAACFYTTSEDLDGADEQELTALGFSTRQATEILAALADILS